LFVIGKVKRNESPAASEPESNAGEFDVTVWVTAPMFLQQTVAPMGTVSVPFWKKLSITSIVMSPGWQVNAA
jgi:hypothetical protein